MVVTDRRQAKRPLVEVIAAAFDGGARTVLLREKDLPRDERLRIASRLRALGASVIAGGPDPLGGNAIHLAEDDTLPAGMGLVGRSCHNVAQIRALTLEGYCTLSPIFTSQSKPGYGPPLGTAVLGVEADVPVLALGGIDTRQRAEACRQAGAAGVAVMGAVMRADNPAAVVKGLLP